jgi:hypothetical protein
MLCHKTLKVTPRDGARLTDLVWSIADVVRLLEGSRRRSRRCLAKLRHYPKPRVDFHAGTSTSLPGLVR